jgi:Co/Zn/Cd efflux system component
LNEHQHEAGHTRLATGKALLIALALTLGYSVIELIAGWRSVHWPCWPMPDTW